MHWLYFTVKTHSVPSPATALLPKLPFLQLPFVMLSTPLRRYHLFILWNNNPRQNKTSSPHTHLETDRWMDGQTDRCMEGWMYDGWTKLLLDWITGINEWKSEQITGKRWEINIHRIVVLAKCSTARWWKRGKMEWEKKWSRVSDSPLCETQFSLLLLFYLLPLWGLCLSGGREIGLLCLD